VEEKPVFKSLERRSLSHRIIDEIRDYIVKQRLKPGDRLATETEMAEALAVSRASVREAVKVLEAIGVLESSPKRGINVKEFDPENFFRYLLFDPYVDVESIVDMAELRLAFEVGIAEVVVERATEEDLARMEEQIEAMRKNMDNMVAFYTHDWAFHFAVYEATRNRFIQALGRLFIEFFVTAHRRWWEADKAVEPNYFKKHEQIFRALKARDAERMRQAVRDHFYASIRRWQWLKRDAESARGGVVSLLGTDEDTDSLKGHS
jgi:DNA-binding FadR family transcriptional regulator